MRFETELLIKKVQDFSEDEIKQVYDYEQKCLSIDKSNIKFFFIEVMDKFLTSGKVYLEDRLKEVFEIQKSNQLSENILSRIEEERAKLDLLIFSGSVMEFRKIPNEFNEEILGNFDFRKSIKSNFSSMKSKTLKEFFSRIKEKSETKVNYLENRKMTFVFKSYPTKSYSTNYSCLNLVLFNPYFTIYRNWKSKQGDIYKFYFSSNEKNIILRFNGKISLVKFDLELNVLKKKNQTVLFVTFRQMIQLIAFLTTVSIMISNL